MVKGGTIQEITLGDKFLVLEEICLRFPLGLTREFNLPPIEGTVDFDGIVCGGFLSVLAVGFDGEKRGATATIHAVNPQKTDIQAELPNNALRRIACKESEFRQFDAPADGGTGSCPLFGPGGRVGIMQVDASTPDQIWDWKANVESGVEKFERHLEEARNYPGRVRSSSDFQALVDEFNVRREAEDLPRLDISVPAFTPKQLELDAIRVTTASSVPIASASNSTSFESALIS